MPDDQLSATLADLRSRHYSVTLTLGGLSTGEPVCYSDRHKWPCHADRALRAVEAVLSVARTLEPAAADLESPDTARWLVASTSGNAVRQIREAITRELLGESGDA